MGHFRVIVALAMFGAFLATNPSVQAAVLGPDQPGVAGEVPDYAQPVAVPLDRDIVFEEVTVGPGGFITTKANGALAGAGERLIYSNILGIHSVNFTTNQPVSDDIAITAPDGCNLTRYRFKVLGRVLSKGA